MEINYKDAATRHWHDAELLATNRRFRRDVISAAKPIRFDEAWSRAQGFMERHPELSSAKPVLVRDLAGRIRLALDDRSGQVPPENVRQALATELDEQLGSFSPGTSSLLLLASHLFAPDEIFSSPDAHALPTGPNYRVLERHVIGSDWLRQPFAEEKLSQRVTLFGIKGGVGRSTAALVLAWRLVEAGRRVLVVDLDLESPGLGSTLLPPARHPDFGVVDWFVEDSVGQADDDLLRDMVALSPLGQGAAELWVVPAGGRPRRDYSYLPKLARAYTELGADDSKPVAFGERLHELVAKLEAHLKPDLVLLDSRAGLHDIAAVTVTRMNALSLLFAVDTVQTWQAYRLLFAEWRAHGDRAAAWRDNLKMVAAQIPETETRAYLASFQQHAYDLFANHLYLETPAGETAEFNFDLNDPDAPHSPLRIHWSRTFQQFDPVHPSGAATDQQFDSAHPSAAVTDQPLDAVRRTGAVTDEQLRAAFGDFVDGVVSLLLGEAI